MNNVTVIIPTCDRPTYLRDAVDSALAQSLPPTRIFVCDNGIAPATPTAHRTVTVIRLQPRSGASAARNAGLFRTETPYVAFLDDDDIWHRDFLKCARAALERQNAHAVYGRKDELRGGVVTPYKCPAKADLTVDTLLRVNPGVGGQNLFLNTNAAAAVGGFDPRLTRANDRGFALDLLLHGFSVGPAPEAIAFLRHHETVRLRHNTLALYQFLVKYWPVMTAPQKLLSLTRYFSQLTGISRLRRLPVRSLNFI